MLLIFAPHFHWVWAIWDALKRDDTLDWWFARSVDVGCVAARRHLTVSDWRIWIYVVMWSKMHGSAPNHGLGRLWLRLR